MSLEMRMRREESISTLLITSVLYLSVLVHPIFSRDLLEEANLPSLSPINHEVVHGTSYSHQEPISASTKPRHVSSEHIHGHLEKLTDRKVQTKGRERDEGFKNGESLKKASKGHSGQYKKTGQSIGKGENVKGNYEEAEHHNAVLVDTNSFKSGKKSGHGKSKKYGKNGGYDKLEEKSEVGENDKYYDDKDTYDWKHTWDTYDEHFKGAQGKGHKQKEQEGGENFTRYAKNDAYKKGKKHDELSGHESGHKRQEELGEDTKYRTKKLHEKKGGSEEKEFHEIISNNLGPTGGHSHHNNEIQDYKADSTHKAPQTHLVRVNPKVKKTDINNQDYNVGYSPISILQPNQIPSEFYHPRTVQIQSMPYFIQKGQLFKSKEKPQIPSKPSKQDIQTQQPHTEKNGRIIIPVMRSNQNPHVFNPTIQQGGLPKASSNLPHSSSFQLFAFVPTGQSQTKTQRQNMKKSASDLTKGKSKPASFNFVNDDSFAKSFKKIRFEDFGDFMNLAGFI